MVKKYFQKPCTGKGKPKRAPRGNMLVLTTAITVGLIMALLFFALNYARLLGSNNEQRTAIEAAALAAAKDLTRIVIDDPNLGFISLSDYAPSGKYAKADDNYGVPTRGINTILATIRSDMIIADRIGITSMKVLAKNDYTMAMQAKDRLVAVLRDAIKQKPVGAAGIRPPYRDIDGNPISVYDDAEKAYKDNQIRMAESGSYYVPRSLKLTLGCVVGVPTNTKVPNPPELASVDDDQKQSDCYLGYVNTPYDGKDFVFAGTGDNIKLVDPRKFQETAKSLPYDISSIVAAQADHHMNMYGSFGSNVSRAVRAMACAMPACVSDPLPSDALTMSWPDGKADTLTIFRNVLTHSSLEVPLTWKRSKEGDTPTGPGRWEEFIPGEPNVTGAFKQLFYDWLKRNRKADISSIVSLMTYPLAGPPNSGFMIVYNINREGRVIIHQHPVRAMPYLPTGEEQWTAEGNDIAVGPARYDIYVNDYVYQAGKTGHGGEPLPELLSGANPLDPTGKQTTIVTNIRDANATVIARFGIDGGSGGQGCGDGDMANIVDRGFRDNIGNCAIRPKIRPTYHNWPPRGQPGGEFRREYSNGPCCTGDITFRKFDVDPDTLRIGHHD